MSHDIIVPRSIPPKFPDRCVLCGADQPGHQVRFHAGGQYGAFFFLAWFESGKKSVIAPACPSCSLGVSIRNWLRFGASAACAAIVGWLLFAVVGGGGRGLFKLKAAAVVIAGIVPVFVWDWIFPPKFSVSFDDEGHKITCHFSDANYAAVFDELNHPPIPDSLVLPEGLQLGDRPAAEPLELPADFNPAAGSVSTSMNSVGPSIESFEDKTNPFRNLSDPRFGK